MVVVKAFIERIGRGARPNAILPFGKLSAADADGNALGLWRRDAKPRVTLRIDLRKLLTGLVQTRWFKIVSRFARLGKSSAHRQQRQ